MSWGGGGGGGGLHPPARYAPVNDIESPISVIMVNIFKYSICIYIFIYKSFPFPISFQIVMAGSMISIYY